MKKSEIKKIYEKFKVPQNIILHMQKVAEICGILADKLDEKRTTGIGKTASARGATGAHGMRIKKNILIKSALLHDVFKPDGKHHATKMANYLRKIGEKSMANLVEKHDFWQIDNLKTWDEKILYYADKRAYEDKLVSLQTRIDEGRKRNPGKISSEVIETEKKMKKLEKEFNLDVLQKRPDIYRRR